MTTQRIYAFTDPLPDGSDARACLGGKGASLREMTRAGLVVPPGFTITTDTCAHVLSARGRWPDGLEDEIAEHMGRLERETGRAFGHGDRPLLVSVRSGAARSMPGMMDTLLNVGLHPELVEYLGGSESTWRLWIQFVLRFVRTVGDIEPIVFEDIVASRPPSGTVSDELLAACRRRLGRPVPVQPESILRECVDAIFHSWNNQRAVDYRRRNRIHDLHGTAVTVQMMWPSEISGIAFTQDPTALDRNRMVIEASYGLGESVVSGEVTPDRYLVPRNGAERYAVEIGEKSTALEALGGFDRRMDPEEACLNPGQVVELAGICRRVEEYFGHPVDLEWGWSEGTFALLQARAIRGLEVSADVERGRRDEISRLRQLAGKSRKVWVAHNLGETLTAPTPLTWDILRRFMSGQGGFGRMYRMLGYRPSRVVREQGFLELISGRIYADPDRLAELFWDGMPMEYDLDALSEDRSLLEEAPSCFTPAKADSRFLLNLPANLLGMVRSHRRTKRLSLNAHDRFEKEVLPGYLDWIDQQRERTLSSLGNAQLLEELDRRRARVLDEFGPESLLPGFFGGMALAKLTTLLEQIIGPGEGADLARTLTLVGEGEITLEQDAMLFDVAHGRKAMGAFLERFGHRCLGEMELSNPRWREDAGYLRTLAARFARAEARDPRAVHEANLSRRHKAEMTLPETLRDHGGSCFEREIRREIERARRLLPYRERGKHYLMMGYELIRRVTEELARRSGLGSAIYFLETDELSRALDDPEAMRERVERRRIRRASAQRLHAPDLIDSQCLERLGQRPEVPGGRTLPAKPLSGGVAEGPACVVADPSVDTDLPEGFVLVCGSTDPAWTPLFVDASALIVERGGALSHGAIVARDFGIPAVALSEATRILSRGQRVRVDGSNGMVHLLDNATAEQQGESADA